MLSSARRKKQRSIHPLQGLPLYGEDATRKVAETDNFSPFWYRGTRDSCFLTEGVGEDDQGDHDDGEDDDDYLQVLLEESAELNGPQALFLEDRCTVPMVSMVVLMIIHIT